MNDTFERRELIAFLDQHARCCLQSGATAHLADALITAGYVRPPM